MMSPTDRLDGGPADHKIPVGDYIRPATAPMPVPRQINDAGTDIVQPGGTEHATQDTIRRTPSSHPALQR